ncbi:polygalacturonase [Lyophyllum atratum]|nr:polygalacturonase [Lyophyllum atratum]
MKPFPGLFFAACLALLGIRIVRAGSVSRRGSACTVHPSSDGISDDAPAIRRAFELCGKNGSILFDQATFHVESVLQTTGLRNVFIDLPGTLLWGTNITYWRANGLPLDYQNQTTAWMFGGDNVTFQGHGVGTFDGNGQLWYDFTNGVSNLAGRPISLMITNTTKSRFTGLRFVQSQFWTMAIKNSEDVLLDSIYVNSTSSSSAPARNTDGVDTFFSDRITFRNWTITGGDDNISLKANSTNILIQDSVFHGGLGVAIGSIGQYLGVFERIENVTAERVVCLKTRYAGYIKTWTGIQQNFPPNGGGGGLGYAKNISKCATISDHRHLTCLGVSAFRDFTLSNVTDSVAHITQCTTFSGATGGCDTSLFQISDVTWGPMVGNVTSGTLASMQCSGSAPCPAIKFVGFENITTTGTRKISCRNILNPVGFNCTA